MPEEEGLSASQRATLKQILESDAQKLRARLGHAVEVHDQKIDAQDAAQQEATREQSTAMVSRDRQQLEDVEQALARLESGTYGICEDTDDPIPFARLVSLPTTRLTADAQAEREVEGGHDTGRKRDPREAY